MSENKPQKARPHQKMQGGSHEAELVSVVIPCYNQAHFLREAIESVLEQTYPHFEIVVVDDGSTDNTSEVASGYYPSEKVRLLRQENKGLSAARNAGLAESGGEYVVFLDADDRLLAEALEVGVRELEAHPECAFVSGHIRRIAADGSPLRTPPQALHIAHVEGDHYLGLLYYNSVWIPGSVMYRRSVFDSVGGFDPSVNATADYDLYLRIVRDYPVHHHGEVVLDYRRHGTNMTRSAGLMLKATVAVLRRQRKHIKGDRRYEEAYTSGLREAQEIYGVPAVEEVRARLWEGAWKAALGGILELLRYYPRGLTLLDERRMERHRLARRLRDRKQEVTRRERQLRNRELALKKERQRVQQLRLQVQNLDQKLRVEQGSGGWKPVQRLRKRLDRGPEGIASALDSIPATEPRQELRGAEQAGRKESVGEHPSGAPGGMEGKTRFFLVGEMKSGTSWLMAMLDSHPEVFCKGEASFFGREQAVEEIPVHEGPIPSLHNALINCEGLRNWRSLSWNYWGRGDAEEDLRNITRLAIDYYLAKGSAASGKRIVGDKSPHHTDYVDEIFGFYPDARIIHIFRDGRDVAVSLMHHFWRWARDRKGGVVDLEPEELDKRDAYLEDPETFLASGESIFIEERLRQMAVRWSRRVSKASREGSELFGSNFLQLSYEDLLERPEENLKPVFEFLGARAEGDIVRGCVEDHSLEKGGGRRGGHENSSSFMRKGVAGDWQKVFTERDRRVYENVAKDTLLEMGYPVDGGPEHQGSGGRRTGRFLWGSSPTEEGRGLPADQSAE